MAPIGKLYSYMPNARVMKAAAKLNEIDIEVVADFQMGITNKTPEFLSKFPAGKVPAFEGVDGTFVAESDAIAQYVAESGARATELLGTTPAERASVRQWVCFTESEVMGTILSLVLWRVGYAPYSEQAEKSGIEALTYALGVVEKRLEDRTWVALDRLSLADITLASGLYWGYMHIIDKAMRQRFPRAVEWYLRTINYPGVKDVFGPPNMIDVRRTPDS
ncbi:hypothetical protein SLS57_004543 [Botryosphaeria dothidea]